MTTAELPAVAAPDGASDPEEIQPTEIELAMEELVYEHLIDLVDFDAMANLEQVLALQLGQLAAKGQLGADHDEDAIADRAAAILEHAWHRMIEDPRRYCDFRGKWEPDSDCELCRMLAFEKPEPPAATRHWSSS